MPPALILASASPRRREILARLDLNFQAHAVDADESLNPAEKRHPALYIAERKARAAQERFPGHWILACDTVVESQLNSRETETLPSHSALQHNRAEHTAGPGADNRANARADATDADGADNRANTRTDDRRGDGTDDDPGPGTGPNAGGHPWYMGKARNVHEARQMLEHLSGREHLVCTGHVLISPDGTVRSEVTVTRVRFRTLDDALLQWYLNTEEWTDKAGAYGIQGYGCMLVERINGDYLNVVGLSPVTLDRLFALAGSQLLDF